MYGRVNVRAIGVLAVLVLVLIFILKVTLRSGQEEPAGEEVVTLAN